METSINGMIYHDPTIRLGFHISKLPGLYDSFERVLPTPLRSYQIYVANARGRKPPKVNVEDIKQTRYLLERHHRYACVHGSLLYNLAGATNGPSDPKYYSALSATKDSLVAELDIAAGFGGGVVVHTGSRVDKEQGKITISNTINSVLKSENENTRKLAKGLQIPISEFKTSRKIILENSAGEGNKLGSTLSEIGEIIDLISDDLKPQVKVCIDTAHIFGAGQYDFGDPDQIISFYEDFDNIIGLDRLEMFHFNDSRVPFGSKKDRHENLGLGYIFDPVLRGKKNYDIDDIDVVKQEFEGLTTFIGMAQSYNIPIIGEPPQKTKDGLPAPGGKWDYEVIRRLYDIEKYFDHGETGTSQDCVNDFSC